jgi:hypothetical protein
MQAILFSVTVEIVDRQPGIGCPGGRDLDKGRRPRVPGRNGYVQIGEDEVRGTTR